MIDQLAKLLGLSREHAEASMHSERAAHAVLTRRNLFAAGAAMATGAAFSFGVVEAGGPWIENFDDLDIILNGHRLPGLVSFTYSLDGGRTRSKPFAVPESGVWVLPGTGLTITFPPMLVGVTIDCNMHVSGKVSA